MSGVIPIKLTNLSPPMPPRFPASSLPFPLSSFLPFLLSLALLPCLDVRAQEAPTDSLPNFVLVFADDLGYGDLGAFGSDVHRTPHLDRMAAEGLRLTSFYATSGVCTPSRASLMTGAYPRRVSLDVNAKRYGETGRQVLFPVAHEGLHPDEATLAEVLKGRGYATACIGKWHLGDQPPFLPTRQGFDVYFGIPYSNDMDRPYAPLPLLRGEEVVETRSDQNLLTQRYTDEAIGFIERHARERPGEPFFLYLPHAMPHNPTAASEPFRGRSKNGRYGDAVEEIDASTGRILEALERLGLAENTLVLFTSDNGAASRWGGSNAPLRGFKGSTMEGGMRVPALAWWPGHVPAGTTSDAMATTMDVLPTFAALAGAPLPERPLDGHDVRPILFGEPGAASPYEAFFYYMKDQLQAVRAGRWKLHLPLEEKYANIHRHETSASGALLVDLASDLGESTNLAAEHPEVVACLTALADSARTDLGEYGRTGQGQRPAGFVATPRPLAPPDSTSR